MAKQGYKTETLEDFTGGLNFRTDQFNLNPNESPDLLNVTVDPRGGIKLRNGVTALNSSALGADVEGLASFFTDGGTSQIIANHGTAVVYGTGSNFSVMSGQTARTADTRLYGMTMNNIFYGVSGDKVSFKWTGSGSGSDRGTDTDGTDGNFPIAQYVTFWNNFAWVGKTREPTTYHNSRVRWSNANQAEKWTATDYVDVDIGEKGDVITGLVPLADRMLIFKNNSVHAIYGFDSDSFQLMTLSRDLGSIALSTPVSTPYGVFFWHDRAGVYLYDGEKFVDVFSKIRPAIDNGRISFASPPQLAWFETRLYLSLDMLEYYADGTQATKRHVLVYDPSILAWSLSDIDAVALHVHTPPGGLPLLLGACEANTGRVIKLEQSNPTDAYDASSAVRIDSYFTTPWLSGKNPVVKKRWGRPQVVLDAASSLTMAVDVYTDYDKASSRKTVDINIEGRESTSVWNTATWGNADGTQHTAPLGIWAAEAANSITDVIRVQSLGNAKSVALKVNGPSESSNWEINGIMFTYKPRRLR
tara:strand:- start:3411 stop:5000 length:1590 start_codon:yes stop_codon:yes gene_type:complete